MQLLHHGRTSLHFDLRPVVVCPLPQQAVLSPLSFLSKVSPGGGLKQMLPRAEVWGVKEELMYIPKPPWYRGRGVTEHD